MANCISQNGIAAPDRTMSSSVPMAPRPLFPYVSFHFRLGKHRGIPFRCQAVVRHEEDLSAPLLLHAESQSGVLLQRCPSDQMGVEAGGHQSNEGRGKKFRGLSAPHERQLVSCSATDSLPLCLVFALMISLNIGLDTRCSVFQTMLNW